MNLIKKGAGLRKKPSKPKRYSLGCQLIDGTSKEFIQDVFERNARYATPSASVQPFSMGGTTASSGPRHQLL